MRDSLHVGRFSISQVTTLTSTFVEDVASYREAALDGIGVWELKLPEGGDEEALEALEASGLGSAAAVPIVPSILPLPLMEGPLKLKDETSRTPFYFRLRRFARL